MRNHVDYLQAKEAAAEVIAEDEGMALLRSDSGKYHVIEMGTGVNVFDHEDYETAYDVWDSENPQETAVMITNPIAWEVQALLNDNDTDAVTYAVIEDIADNMEPGENVDQSIMQYLNEITSHGCISGIVSRLIYTADCRKFFDTHYETIMIMAEEAEEESGIQLNHREVGDLKTFYAWFSYEQAALNILIHLESLDN